MGILRNAGLYSVIGGEGSERAECNCAADCPEVASISSALLWSAQ
jgi:hypothetical protein